MEFELYAVKFEHKSAGCDLYYAGTSEFDRVKYTLDLHRASLYSSDEKNVAEIVAERFGGKIVQISMKVA